MPTPRRGQGRPTYRWIVASALIGALVAAATSLVAAPASSTPPALAAAASRAYVGLFKENAVAVLDTSTNTVLSKIAVPAGPHGLAVTPDGRKVYIASDGATTVSAIDTSTDSITRTIEVGKAPHGVTVTPDGRLLLVGVWGDNQVAFVDTATDQVVRQSSVGAAHNIALTPDGSQAYVGSQATDAPALVRISVGSGEALSRVPMDGAPRGIAISPDGAWLYVTRAGADDVLVLDVASEQEQGRIAIGPSPHLPTFASNSVAVVDSQGLGQLLSVDPASRAVVGSVAVGQRPHWTAISADGKTAFQTNEASNDVSVVDLPTMTVLATIPIGEAPRKIVVLPGATPPNTAAQPPAGGGSTVASGAPAASGPAPAGTTESRIERFRFDSPIEISAGQGVAWVNADSTAHTVTGDGREWDSGTLEPGRQFVKTFESPGAYGYFCELHSYMRGRVTVR